MRTKSLALTALAVAALPFGAHAQDFEGTVTYRMSMAGMTMEMTQFIKGKKLRQEMAGPMGNMVVIMDSEAGKMSMSAPGQPPMVMDIESMKAMAGAEAQAAAQADIEVSATGEKETIAGHDCEHFLIKQATNETDVCAATGLGFHMSSMEGGVGGGAAPAGWEKLRDRFADGFFPLKMTTTTPQGSMVMEAVTLEKKSLSDDLFKIEG